MVYESDVRTPVSGVTNSVSWSDCSYEKGCHLTHMFYTSANN
jgi:hypothetical protein